MTLAIINACADSRFQYARPTTKILRTEIEKRSQPRQRTLLKFSNSTRHNLNSEQIQYPKRCYNFTNTAEIHSILFLKSELTYQNIYSFSLVRFQ